MLPTSVPGSGTAALLARGQPASRDSCRRAVPRAADRHLSSAPSTFSSLAERCLRFCLFFRLRSPRPAYRLPGYGAYSHPRAANPHGGNCAGEGNHSSGVSESGRFPGSASAGRSGQQSDARLSAHSGHRLDQRKPLCRASLFERRQSHPVRPEPFSAFHSLH